MMRRIDADPNDLARLSDELLLQRIMNLTVETRDYRREGDHVAYLAGKKILDLHLYEATQRMQRRDPVLRRAYG